MGYRGLERISQPSLSAMVVTDNNERGGQVGKLTRVVQTEQVITDNLACCELLSAVYAIAILA
ncbi:hypothetical protein AG1IA_09883 [Rhizoctonia solani AG-1 IA]|uniref:Uncharacterized protein n=1 Tax=Thanatephorus cucumeris (strain AG1-IA) TaxID=983506 RepID=L8WH78_THACA|nr:hypothetical protein AG1IA_09883 [Rhizoctonia solani AG-1 IA]